MKKTHWIDRLSFKMARSAVLIAFSVGIMLSFLQVYIDYLEEGDSLDTRADEILSVAHKAAARSVLILDPDLAQEVVSGLMEYEFITQASILDDHGSVLASETGQPTNDDAAIKLARTFITDTIKYEKGLGLPNSLAENPGKLVVKVDRAVGLRPFFSRSLTIFLSGFVRNMLLVALLYVAFYANLTKPLSKLVDEVEQLNPENPGEKRITIPEGHRDDEIGIMARQINGAFDNLQSMLDNLRATNRALGTSEEALRKRSWELEKEVDHSREMTIQLIKTKEEAEAANRAKSAFLANVSHELRTPLNAIIGFSTIMTDQIFGPVGNEKYVEYLDDIRNSSQHLSDLLGEVLDLAKIESGQEDMEDEDVNIVDLCSESIALISGQAVTKRIKLVTDLDETLPFLKGSRLRLKQSVLNLLSNAIKFTPEGAGSVTLKAWQRDDTGISISVSDTGIGIPEEDQSSVFSPFMRASGALSRSHEGTGLGLALVKAFMNEHEGDIELHSVEGEGTSITLNLPVNRTMLKDSTA